MGEARISVIIPAYQAAETIGRALRSVSLQTLAPVEVIVVDDGSDDGTAELAESMRDHLEGINLIVFRQENRGAGAARNKAIIESSGSLLAFLDADDEWMPAKLERSVAELSRGNFSLVAHNSWIVKGREQLLNNCAERFKVPGDPYGSLYKRGYIDTCTVVVRRDLVFAVGGFDETLPSAQDFDLWLAVLQDPEEKFLVFEDILSRYYVTPGSIMSFTERRRTCGLRIARRFVPVLKKRGISWLSAIVFRVFAIHYEAISSYWEMRRISFIVRTMLMLSIALVETLIRGFMSDYRRPKNL